MCLLIVACQTEVNVPQVLQQQLLSLKKSPGQRKSKAQDPGLNVKSILLPMELRLVLQGAVVKFEHHSLEVLLHFTPAKMLPRFKPH